MKTKYITIILFGMLFVACKKSNSLKNYMVGKWETTYIKIKYPTDSTTIIFEEDFSKPNIGKAQSKYNNDGTFSAWFKQPNGEKTGESFGKWTVKEDSLFVDFFHQKRQVKASYFITPTENGFEGVSVYDWDQDGKFDDTLLMKTKKIKL